MQAQQLWCTGPVAPRHVGSSQTRARTRVPCIGRQILNHCATREAPRKGCIFKYSAEHECCQDSGSVPVLPARECAQCESLWEIQERTPGPTQAVAEARQRIQTTACAVNPSPRCHQPAWFTQVSSTASIKWPPCQAPPGTGEQRNSSLSKALKGLRLHEAQHRLPPDAQGNSSVSCQSGGGLVVSACMCLCAHVYVCVWVQGAPCLS